MPPATTKEAPENRPHVTKSWIDNLPAITPEAISTPENAPKPAPAPSEPQKPSAPAEPAKPAPAATPEPPPTSPAEPEESKMPRTSAEWKKFRELRDAKEKEYQTKLAETEKQMAELKAKPAAPSDYDAVKKRADEYAAILERKYLEDFPEFKSAFDNRINQAIESAKQLVGTDLAGEVSQIMSMPPSAARQEKMTDFWNNLTPYQQSMLGGIDNQVVSLQAAKSHEISKSKENVEAIKKYEAQQQQAKAEGFQKTFDAEIKRLETDSPAFQKREGDEAWNSEVDQRVATAKHLLFGETKPEALIQAATYAASFPAVLKQNLGLMEKIATLEKQIQEMSSATPKLPGDRTPAANGEQSRSVAPTGSRPMDALAGTWMRNLPKLGS